jgi:simple sugar transport system ATP-binding protein
VVLAKWMARRPRLLILDSPTVGVDISAKDGIYEIIRGLAQEGAAVIVISDEIPEALFQSHRIIVMERGKIRSNQASAQATQVQIDELVNG